MTKKKTSKAKTAKKKQSNKIFGDAPADNLFVLVDGTTLKNFFELAETLGTMTDEVFGHHVSEAHNDFANWAKDVFEAQDLAGELELINKRIETQITLLRHLAKKLTQLK